MRHSRSLDLGARAWSEGIARSVPTQKIAPRRAPKTSKHIVYFSVFPSRMMRAAAAPLACGAIVYVRTISSRFFGRVLSKTARQPSFSSPFHFPFVLFGS